MMARYCRRDFLNRAALTVAGLSSARLFAADDQPEVSWLAEVQQPPANFRPTGTGHFDPLLVSGDNQPITTVEQWQQRRTVLRDHWINFLGPMPERPPVKLAAVSEDRPEGCHRVLVRYECEPGQLVEGYLLFPDPLGKEPRAGLVVLHPTTPDTIYETAGVKGRESRALGLHLAREGFIVFCPKCFLWQDPALDYNEAVAEFQKRNPGALGMRKMLNDAQAAVDVLGSLPEVDATRIGATGHSLGAKEALYLAAFDERIRAAVASEGGIGLGFTNWHDPWYAPDFKLDHHQVLALIAPRAFLILAGESGPPDTSVADGDRSWPFVEATLPVYKLYGEPARIGLYNHRQGHTIPPEAFDRMREWLQMYLMKEE